MIDVQISSSFIAYTWIVVGGRLVVGGRPAVGGMPAVGGILVVRSQMYVWFCSNFGIRDVSGNSLPIRVYLDGSTYW